MKQRTLLILSVTLTVFVLAVVGGVVRAAVVSQTAENDALKAAYTQMQEQYATREAEYNKLIEEANQNILKANQNQQTLEKQIRQIQTAKDELRLAAQKPAPAPAPVAAPVEASIPVDTALKTAMAIAKPDSKLTKTPELVQYEGKTAYEVVFDSGPIYLAAQNGEILFNGTLPREITRDEAGQIALNYLKGTHRIYQIDKIQVNGKVLWRVIVVAGHMVYMDPTGQVVYVQMYEPPSSVAASSNGGGGGGGGGGGKSSSPPSGEHEGGGGDD